MSQAFYSFSKWCSKGSMIPLVLLSGMIIAGCGKAKPAPDSGFLQQPARMTERRERFPFNRVWVKPGVIRERYTEIVIAPINTAYLMETNWWKQANARNGSIRDDAKQIARDGEKAFQKAVMNDPKQRLRLVQTPGPRAVVLEMALVELVPSKVALGVLGLAALPLRVPALAVGSKVTGKGSVAIEARWRDGGTGEIIGMMADREVAKTAPINVAAATWYRFAEQIFNDWAAQMIELVNTPPGHKVSDSKAFTLKPW